MCEKERESEKERVRDNSFIAMRVFVVSFLFSFFITSLIICPVVHTNERYISVLCRFLTVIYYHLHIFFIK